jgi:hypothetical protein
MSIEQLLFLLLLLGVPLLERIVRALRERAGVPADPTPKPPEAPVYRPPAPVPLPDTAAAGPERGGTQLPLPRPPLPRPPFPPPPLPQAVPPAAPARLSEWERQRRTSRERKQGPAAHSRTGHPDRALGSRRVIGGGDLRRAIVLMAILGPCRALEPKDPSTLG